MQGELRGKQLDQVPSVMTDWKSWKEKHPQTDVVVLSRTMSNYKNDFYRNLDRFVLGIANSDSSRAWKLSDLKSATPVHDQFEGQQVVVTFDPGSSTARLFSPSIDGIDLEFESRDGHLIDRSTKSQWDPITGRCRSGRFEGKHLKPLSAILSFAKVWERFHPNSTWWQPEQE